MRNTAMPTSVRETPESTLATPYPVETRPASGLSIANGYQGATIASIARRAKVAAQTVYFVFHTRAALISAVIEAAVIGAEDPTPAASVGLVGGDGGISGILRAAALTDEELAGTYPFQEDLWHRSFRHPVEVVSNALPLLLLDDRERLTG